MNALLVAVIASLVVFANAKPSAVWAGHGHAAINVVPAGPTTLVGASGVVGPNGASGPAGSVNGHGAVGPNGEHNAVDQEVVAFAPAVHAHAGIWAAPAVVQHSAIAVAPVAHGIVGGHGFVGGHGLIGEHGLVGAHGLGHGHGAWW